MQQPIKFSVSRFNLQSACLQKYRFKYIDKIPAKEIVWASTIFGLALHEFFEDIFKHDYAQIRRLQKKSLVTKADMLNFFDGKDIFAFFEEQEAKAESEKKIIKINRKWDNKYFLNHAVEWSVIMFRFILNLSIGFDKAEPEKNFEIEYTIPGTTDSVLLLGFIDLVLEKAGKRFIYDYKNTTNPHEYYFVGQNDIQSNVYMFVEKEFFRNDIESFTYLVSDMFTSMIFSKTNFFGFDYNSIFKAFLIRHRIASKNPTGAVNTVSCMYCEYKNRCDKRRV